MYDPGIRLLKTEYAVPLCVCGAGWLAEDGVNWNTVPVMPVPDVRTAVQDVSAPLTCIARARIVPGTGVEIGVGVTGLTTVTVTLAFGLQIKPSCVQFRPPSQLLLPEQLLPQVIRYDFPA